MARGRKGGPSRMDLRRQAEAAEARDKDDETEVEEGDEEEDEEEDEEGGDAEDVAEGDDDEGGDDDEDGEPKPKKKKAVKAKAPAVKKPAAKRTRVKEAPRMKAVWVVFDNSGKRVKEFPYPQRADAEKLLAERIEEKKTTFYIQLVKEPMEA